MCKLLSYSQLTVSLSRLDVTEFLNAVTEKDASGKTVRTYPPTGMPTHDLPTEGVCVVLKSDFTKELERCTGSKLD